MFRYPNPSIPSYTHHDCEVTQLVALHHAGVHDGVEVEGALLPTLAQLPRHLAQLGAGMTPVLITVAVAETQRSWAGGWCEVKTKSHRKYHFLLNHLELSQPLLQEFRGFDKTGGNVIAGKKHEYYSCIVQIV